MCFYDTQTQSLSPKTAVAVFMILIERNVGWQVSVCTCSWHTFDSKSVFVLWSFVVSWKLLRAHGLPPWKHWCTVGFIAGTHQCATESKMTLWQSANPSLCCLESWHRVFCALGFVVVFHAHVQLRILTLLLDWKRCSSSQSSSFSVIRTIRSKISAGWECSLQLNFSCFLPAMSQSILFTQNATLFLSRKIDQLGCTRFRFGVSLQSSRRETRCTSCQQFSEPLQLSLECQA